MVRPKKIIPYLFLLCVAALVVYLLWPMRVSINEPIVELSMTATHTVTSEEDISQFMSLINEASYRKYFSHRREAPAGMVATISLLNDEGAVVGTIMVCENPWTLKSDIHLLMWYDGGAYVPYNGRELYSYISEHILE